MRFREPEYAVTFHHINIEQVVRTGGLSDVVSAEAGDDRN